MLKSDKLNNWFQRNKNRHGDLFWDFLFENKEELFDARESDGDNIDELLLRGFDLGQKAGSQLVYLITSDDISEYDDYFSHFSLYFIGEELDIIDRLQIALDSWTKSISQDKDGEKAKLKKQIATLEKELELKYQLLNSVETLAS